MEDLTERKLRYITRERRQIEEEQRNIMRDLQRERDTEQQRDSQYRGIAHDNSIQDVEFRHRGMTEEKGIVTNSKGKEYQDTTLDSDKFEFAGILDPTARDSLSTLDETYSYHDYDIEGDRSDRKETASWRDDRKKGQIGNMDQRSEVKKEEMRFQQVLDEVRRSLSRKEDRTLSRDTTIPKPTTPHEYTYINEEGVLQSVRATYESKNAGNEQEEEKLELATSQPPRKIASLSDKLLQGQKVSSTKTFTKKEYADEPLDISDTQER